MGPVFGFKFRPKKFQISVGTPTDCPHGVESVIMCDTPKKYLHVITRITSVLHVLLRLCMYCFDPLVVIRLRGDRAASALRFGVPRVHNASFGLSEANIV